MIDAPPLEDGAVHFTVTTWMAVTTVAVTVLGDVDGPTGTTLGEAELAAEVPAAFVAFTVNV